MRLEWGRCRFGKAGHRSIKVAAKAAASVLTKSTPGGIPVHTPSAISIHAPSTIPVIHSAALRP
jgi:hypothetical protein